MNSRETRKWRVVIVSAVVSHLLAGAAFLGILFWPFPYQEVSATPVNFNDARGADSEVVHYSQSFIEVNGIGALIPAFIPVVVSGLAMLFLATRGERSITNTLVIWALTVLLLLFCGLAIFSIGILYAPSAIALIVAAGVYGTVRRLPSLKREQINRE